MTLVLLNKHFGQFTKLYLSRGLCKITTRPGLDLGRKTSINILSVLMQRLGFRIYEREFLTKQAIRPLQDRSDLTGSCPSISSSMLKTALPSLDSLNPITIAYWFSIVVHFIYLRQKSIYT